MRQTLASLSVSLRDLLISVGPFLLLAVALLVGAYWWIQPEPPHKVRLATGPEGSSYAVFGKRYADQLKPYGITVELVATQGSSQNLELLRKEEVDAGFVRGGSVDAVQDGSLGITSLGSLFYEPLWIFYREAALPRKTVPTLLPQLAGLRFDVDQPGSGVPTLMDRLFQANHLDAAKLRLLHMAPEDASAALLTGKLDVMALTSAPQSPIVHKLLRAPGIGLVDLAQADAYSRRFGFFSSVTLPRGVADLSADVPARDVSMVTLTTSLLVREDMHPALRELFADAAVRLHGEAGWFNRARDFPNTRTSELPVSPEGDLAINGTPPPWKNHVPFWLSNLLQRMGLLIGGLLLVLLPLSRIVPPLYAWRVRRRVFRWYALLREVEERFEAGSESTDQLLERLAHLDARINRVAVPLSYVDELYALRNNVHAVRKRVLAKAQGAASELTPNQAVTT